MSKKSKLICKFIGTVTVRAKKMGRFKHAVL